MMGLLILSVVTLTCGIITFKMDIEDEEIRPFTVLMFLVSFVAAVLYACYWGGVIV